MEICNSEMGALPYNIQNAKKNIDFTKYTQYPILKIKSNNHYLALSFIKLIICCNYPGLYKILILFKIYINSFETDRETHLGDDKPI